MHRCLNVRFGSLTDISGSGFYVRFTPDNGHKKPKKSDILRRFNQPTAACAGSTWQVARIAGDDVLADLCRFPQTAGRQPPRGVIDEPNF